MMESTAYFSRRRWLELMLASGGALATGSLYEILAQLPSRQVTPNMVLGPFYPQIKPADRDDRPDHNSRPQYSGVRSGYSPHRACP